MIFSRENLRLTLIFIFIAAILWLVFSPVQLGGVTSYVVITGNSMEPDFKIGDLILTRKNPIYQVDQRVVYDNPKVGHVFHRIIDRDNDLFILKGDNNDWIDSYHPGSSEIIGKFWFSIPGGGSVITKLREPLYFTLFSLIILLILVSILFGKKDFHLFKKKGKYKLKMKKEKLTQSRESRQDLLLFLAVVLVAALVLGFISYSRPLTKMVTEEIPFLHQGEVNYFAPDQSGIYDSSGVHTGDPVFSQLNCILDLEFDYQFTAQNISDLEKEKFSGSYFLYGEVSDLDGWKRSFSLVPETDFIGTKAAAWTLLDLCRVQSLFIEKEQITATDSRHYKLSIYPRVSISGSVNGVSVAEEYRPEVSFQIDKQMMRLQDGFEGLNIDQDGVLLSYREVRNSLQIFGREFAIETARTLSLITLGIAILAAIIPVRSLYLDLHASEQSRIAVQYHPLLLNLEKGSAKTKTSHVIQVSSFQDLVKIAERYGSMILHESRGKTHHYSIQDDGTLYRYTMVVSTPPEEKSKS